MNAVIKAASGVLFCAGLAAATLPRAAHADDKALLESLTLEKLQAANNANRQAVATVVSELIVSETYRERPGGEQAARERMTDAYLRSREAALESASASGASEQVLEQIREDSDYRLNSVEEAMIVRRLNRNVRVARTSLIDFALQQARYDDQDLRDLVPLAAQHGLDEDQRQHNLGRSHSRILKEDQSVLLVRAGKLAVLRARPRFSADLEASHLGIIPSWVLQGDLQLTLRTVAGNSGDPYLELIGRKAGRSANHVLVEIRPEYGHRLTRMVTYDENGEVQKEFRASDYRTVDDIPVPFTTKMRRSAYGIAGYFVRLRQVKSVRLNQAIEPASFQIPDGYHVQDIRGPGEPGSVPQAYRSRVGVPSVKP